MIYFVLISTRLLRYLNMQRDIGDDGLAPWRWFLVILAEAILSTWVSIIQLPIRICNGNLGPAPSQLQASMRGCNSVPEVRKSRVVITVFVATQASK